VRSQIYNHFSETFCEETRRDETIDLPQLTLMTNCFPLTTECTHINRSYTIRH